MNDWFEWNGVKCTEYGMHMLTPPSFIVAQERVENVEVPGRSGTLTMREGENVYNNINLSAICVIDTPYENESDLIGGVITKIASWLKGDGNVTFFNRQGGYYKGRISNQISFDKILRGNPHRSFSVEFQCDPFFYLNSGNEALIFTETSKITNEGNIPSEPLIKITGTGEATLMCGNNTMIINSLDDIEYLMIDSSAMVAYKGESGNPNDPLILLGTRVSGDWLKIPVGDSFLSIVGSGIESVTVWPRWRCL